MNYQPSHLVFLIGTAFYLAIRAAFQIRFASQDKPVCKTDALDRLLVVLVGTGQVVLPCIYLFSPWLNWADYALPQGLIWVATPVMAGALWLFWRSHTDLGNCWSVILELNRDHRLVTQGVYRFIRHPMYASFFGLALGQAMLLNNWLAGWSGLTAITLLYAVRIPHEEQMMLESFGDEYQAYMRRTGGIIPRRQSIHN